MRKLAFIGILFVLTWSCTRQDMFCRVTLRLDTDDPIVALTIDNTLEGNYFRNLNTGETYAFPVFINGKCEMKVLNGVYVLAFDGVAALPDGTARRVRSAEHATALDAVTLIDNEATLTLKLMSL